MGDFAELGLEGANKVIDKHFEKTYEALHKHLPGRGRDNYDGMNGSRGYQQQRSDRDYDSASDDSYDERPRRRQGKRDRRNDRAPPRYESPVGGYGARGFEPTTGVYNPPTGGYEPPKGGYGGRDYDPPTGGYEPPKEGYEGRDYDPPTGGYGGRDSESQTHYQAYRPGNSQSYDTLPRPSSRDYDGAVAPYRRERSRPRRERRAKSQDRRRGSRSRSRSQDRSRDFEDNPLMAFDRSERGIGVGLAGALVGGFLGHEVSERHQKRASALGAILGGIGANLVENRVRIYLDEKKESQRQAADAWEASHRDERRRRRESPMR